VKKDVDTLTDYRLIRGRKKRKDTWGTCSLCTY
jgi:hypothetical protein